MRKQKYSTFFLLYLLSCWFVNVFSFVTAQEENETIKVETFRPPYAGYARGTVELISMDENTSVINREWNLEGWNLTQTWDYDKGKWVSSLAMHIVYCENDWLFWPSSSGVYYPPAVRVYISTDNGATFTTYRDFGRKILIMDQRWAPYNESTSWLYTIGTYYFDFEDVSLFGPTTRIKVLFLQTMPFEPPIYIGNFYWGPSQKPVPPWDYIDESDNYVQYAIWFTAEFTEEKIVYNGPTVSYAYDNTKERLRQAATMILNTMHPSGLSNEVVTTDIPFGTHTWCVIYSSQLAMMELIDLMKIFPEENYLLPVKRFIVWMWSKQNGDGSFPFILTDGDQHCWFNATADAWYGYDKIDSFSACAISLMRKYYDATEDLDFLNRFWSNILLAKEFIYSLMDFDVWLPVDGFHYNGTHYVKSQWNWLHDICEAYQGMKDLSYLYQLKGETENAVYWNNTADSVAAAVRERMWNETLGRYVGMYNVETETQDPTLVYNIITPVIYGIETNVTRAARTVNTYVNWGILSGRYLDRKWAEDYEVYNEYSTMSGMLLSAFVKLINLGYAEQWMKQSVTEITKFLFTNPVYPYRDLQNQDGFLDFVNLINYTWAGEYARLIESSAWFIDSFVDLEVWAGLFNYSRTDLINWYMQLKNENEFWTQKYAEFKLLYGVDWNADESNYNLWVEWLKTNQLYVQWYDFKFSESNFLYILGIYTGTIGELSQEQFYKHLDELGDKINFIWWEQTSFPPEWLKDKTLMIRVWLPVLLGMGLCGLLMLSAGPLYIIKKYKEGEYLNALAIGLLLLVIGLALFIVWLWS